MGSAISISTRLSLRLEELTQRLGDVVSLTVLPGDEGVAVLFPLHLAILQRDTFVMLQCYTLCRATVTTTIVAPGCTQSTVAYSWP